MWRTHGGKEMRKFRKKPVIIEAVQFTGLNFAEIEDFVGGDFGKDSNGHSVISTLEGAMHVSSSDWVIKGVEGEFYPCKPDIFKKTYEEVK